MATEVFSTCMTWKSCLHGHLHVQVPWSPNAVSTYWNLHRITFSDWLRNTCYRITCSDWLGNTRYYRIPCRDWLSNTRYYRIPCSDWLSKTCYSSYMTFTLQIKSIAISQTGLLTTNTLFCSKLMSFNKVFGHINYSSTPIIPSYKK